MTTRSTPFENPLLHFEMYGLRNPVVQWAIERGLYDSTCAGCGGSGRVFRRPCFCMEPGNWPAIQRVPGGRLRCRSVCRERRGAGLLKDFWLLEQDFGEEESMAFAERHFGARPKMLCEQPPAFGTRRLR